VQLPESITATEAKVIVICEEKTTQPSKPIKYDLFKGNAFSSMKCNKRPGISGIDFKP
jgi:hypothetical protein